jgi:pilus assembly protein CpaF
MDVPNPITGGTNKRCLFDADMLNRILEEELGDRQLEYTEMLDIITILVYRQRYGFGVVDTLRGLDIDGFNFGTSGSVRYVIDGTYNVPYRTTNSIWVQLNAKWIHFSFLDFKKEEEMKRIVNQLVAWGTTAPMTEKSPYKVNDAYDGARVTAIRPPAGECWACFVRKFSSGLYVKEKLLNKPTVHNWELPSTLMYYLMRGEQTTAFTGQQNTGKTSMMKAAMADVAMVNIRILEMSFELAIRELYPWKNVLTVKPTDYVSAANLQDLLKKTDGYLSMVGEVAEDIVAARMIQFCLIASAFTIFSHHAKTDADLINGLANSLVACGEYENHDVALSTVLDAIKNNVHLDFVKGERVIAFISEIVKLNEIEPYPELNPSSSVQEAIDQLAALQREYYTRSTDRVRFTSRHIIEFNTETMTYEAKEGYTPEALKRICSKLKGDDRKNFIAWYRENWAHVLTA